MKKKLLGILVCTLMIFATVLPVKGNINVNENKIVNLYKNEKNQIQKNSAMMDNYVPGEAIVGFYGPLPYLFQNITYKISQKYNVSLKDTNDELCAALYTDVDDEILIEMLEDPDIKWGGRNYEVTHYVIPNDPGWSNQWGPPRIGAPAAWDCVTGSSTLKVAVVDTGIDYNHPELSGNYLPGGYDWINHDTDPMDDHGHGTHCAGIIGAVGNNNVGIAGMTWNIKLIAEKVLRYDGYGTYWSVGQGIAHACLRGAKIISLSLGGESYSSYLHQAVKFAYNQGCLLVVASGNNPPGSTDIRYPAKFSEAIAVGATDSSDTKPTWGNSGLEQELVAPGAYIYSTLPGSSYGYLSGTSMACPHVAGTAALIWSANPDLTRDEVRCFLRSGAEDLGAPGWDQEYGYGLVRADSSVSNARFRYSISVTPTSYTIPPGGTETFTITVTDTSLCPGTTPIVYLNLDPFYSEHSGLDYDPYPISWAVTPTPSGVTETLEVSVPSDARSLTAIHRVEGTCMVAGCQIVRQSNFFMITTDAVADDMVWIQTCDADTGSIPRTGLRVWESPWIESEPDPPEYMPTANKLHVEVGNLDPTNPTGPVEVTARWQPYPGFCPIDEWPKVEPGNPIKHISDILGGDTETVTFSNWYIPDAFPENEDHGEDHICVVAQAWRNVLEPFDDMFDVIGNNNIGQKNMHPVAASSPYTTIFKFNNPTNKTISAKFYAETPNMDWTVVLCEPCYIEDGKVVTPLMIPPGENISLNLTINLPPEEDSGTVTIQYIVEGYDYIYPDISYFTFDVYRDTAPPVIEVTRPKGIYLLEKELIPLPFDLALVIGAVTIKADASDGESGISRVEFYVGDELIGTDYEEPYECLWKNTSGLFGKHIIKAKAYDEAENSINSNEIKVWRFF